jgi:ubiquinone/menaquinone biosynthesis C-methylase UbiE
MRWRSSDAPTPPNWYLHPLVAEQKRRVHLDLVRRWTDGLVVSTALKTDLFEEAFGDDDFYLRVFEAEGAGEAGARTASSLCGMDIMWETAHRARRRCLGRLAVLVTDTRQLGLADNRVDVIISNSTLDHFGSRGEFLEALAELARVLRPGGRIVLTLDNPANPLYPLLRWITRRGWAPYALGYTPSLAQVERDLHRLGLTVVDREWLIHNPRLVSTFLFGLLRQPRLVSWLLRQFARLGTLPTRSRTACFHAVCAEKPPR